MTKPIVYYRKLISCREGDGALVIPVNHPGEFVSNTCEALTSPVVRYDRKSGEFETQNTIYQRAPLEMLVDTAPAKQKGVRHA